MLGVFVHASINERERVVLIMDADSRRGFGGSLRTIPIVSGAVDESQYSNDAYFRSVFYLQNVYLSSKLLITCILLHVLLVFCTAG